WLYELDDETLRLCWPNVFGDYPDALSDRTHGVVTLTRYFGPPPETKRPSGKKPIENPILGRLTWNDSFDWWQARVELMAGSTIEFYVRPGDGQDDGAAVKTGQEFV